MIPAKYPPDPPPDEPVVLLAGYSMVMLGHVPAALLLVGVRVAATGSTLSIGTPKLLFELADGDQPHWGCLASVLVGGDPDPTEHGVLAGATQVCPGKHLII